jgi:hypothetical protein
VTNPAGVEKGVSRLVLNGKPLPGNFIPANQLAGVNQVSVELG